MIALAVAVGLILIACVVAVSIGCRAIWTLCGQLERGRRNEYRIAPRISRPAPHSTTGASPELETAPADDTETGRQGDNASRAQQLRAAHTIFGRQH